MVAGLAGGRFTGEAAVDTAAPSPSWALRGTLAGAAIERLPAPAVAPFTGGTLDLDVDLSARGGSDAALLATVSGSAHGSLHGASLGGLDMARLGKLLLAHGPRLRAALSTALSSGQSGPLSGGFDADISNGTFSFAHAAFTGAAGSVALEGDWDLSAAATGMRLRVLPAVADPPTLTVIWSGQHRSTDVQPGLTWAHPPTPKPKPITHS
jgi:uncharacterized protein involved in outer membrane biogenesis